MNLQLGRSTRGADLVARGDINATECDLVVTGTPIDLGRLIDCRHPIRHVRYELEEIGRPTLDDVLRPIVGLAVLERDRLVESRP
jgi:predicted GTPase